jgi:hypothetical protein
MKIMMKIERITEASGAGADTHKHRGYQKAFRYVREKLFDYPDHEVLDLFARECPWGDYRNDLNEKYLKARQTNMCMDALEACQSFDDRSIDIILFDPPFSSRMDADKYGEVGRASLWTDAKYISDLGKEMFRILECGGYIVKCGFNSNSPYPKMELERMFVSHYGSCRNDVIFTIWKKVDSSILDYISVG